MNYGCKGKLPHAYEIEFDNPQVQAEKCSICGDEIKFQKDSQGRIDNLAYLKAHLREFCQPTGPTAKLYYILYAPELYEPNRHLWSLDLCTTSPCIHDKRVAMRDITKKGTNANA